MPARGLDQLQRRLVFTDQDGIPTRRDLAVAGVEFEQPAQMLEIACGRQLAAFMLPEWLIGNQALTHLFDRQAGFGLPAAQRAFDTDVDHDAAEIEQQCFNLFR